MKRIVLLIVTLLIVVFVFVFLNIKKSNEVILYSWTQTDTETENFFEILKEMKVDILYQDFKTSYLENNNHSLIEKLHDNNIKVYHLAGEKEWAYDVRGIKKEIDKVINYNKSGEKIDGIVLDIEKYLDGTDKFKQEVYLETLKDAYTYSKDNNIYMVLAIPYWFDSKYGEKYIEDIIHYGCDEVSVMNYKISNTLNGISNEVKYSRKYKKKMNTIYEIDFKDNDKFKSYADIYKDFKNIQNEYNYNKIGIAFHYYKTVREDYLETK